MLISVNRYEHMYAYFYCAILLLSNRLLFVLSQRWDGGDGGASKIFLESRRSLRGRRGRAVQLVLLSFSFFSRFSLSAFLTLHHVACFLLLHIKRRAQQRLRRGLNVWCDIWRKGRWIFADRPYGNCTHSPIVFMARRGDLFPTLLLYWWWWW